MGLAAQPWDIPLGMVAPSGDPSGNNIADIPVILSEIILQR